MPISSSGRDFYVPDTYWLIGDSHVLRGSGLAVGLNMAAIENGDKFHMDTRVGARSISFIDFATENYLSPSDKIVVSLGINSSKMPLDEARKQVEDLIVTFGGRECFWIFPPVESKDETNGYWEMMEDAVKPCFVFDSKKELKPPKSAIMGKFHLKIGYARKVWAPKVWDWIKNQRGKE